MNEEETIKAGKATLHRTRMGTVWFLDKNGNKTTVAQDPVITKLFETIRDGSGTATENKLSEGTVVSENVTETNSALTIGGNGFASYGEADVPLTDH